MQLKGKHIHRDAAALRPGRGHRQEPGLRAGRTWSSRPAGGQRPGARTEPGQSRRVFIRTDVTSEEDGKAAVDLAGQGVGALQGLVNCAGIAVAEKTLGKNGPHVLAKLHALRHRQPESAPST